MQASLSMGGALAAKIIRAEQPPLAWKLRNTLHWGFIWGWLTNSMAVLFSKVTGIPTLTSELCGVLIRGDGTRVNYGVLSRRVVTDAGVALMVNDFKDGSGEITSFKYHGCGTGTGNEAAGDTTLGTECTTALNPDSTRATGTNTAPTAPVYRSVGTLTFDADAAVTEHGIFSQSATGGGTLWDRSKFSAINVVGANGDSIQFTYNLTINSGG